MKRKKLKISRNNLKKSLGILKEILYVNTRNKTDQEKIDWSIEKKGEIHMKDINTVRKAVTAMANHLHKLGYSLSQAFKSAWKRAKNCMKCRVAGVTYEKRQQLLQFTAGRKHEDLTVYLQRDRANTFDKNAVAVVVGICNVGYAHIGYLPKGLSQSLAKGIDKGIGLQADV